MGKDEKEVIETVTIGDTVYEASKVSPSIYFDYVKGLKQKLDHGEYDIIIDTTLKMLEKSKITGQTDMAKRLTGELELAIRELDAAKAGFDIFVPRKAIEEYITAVEAKSIKIIELANYEREIPDDVIDKISKAREIFDELYIIFTDYTKKETKKVASHRRDKDPILFGAFKNVSDKSNIYIEDRLFYIVDWVEDKCDLTLEELCRDIKDKKGVDITYKLSNPKDEEAAKKILNSYKSEYVKDTELEPVTIFEKIKKKVTRKKKDDSSKKKPAKRGKSS